LAGGAPRPALRPGRDRPADRARPHRERAVRAPRALPGGRGGDRARGPGAAAVPRAGVPLRAAGAPGAHRLVRDPDRGLRRAEARAVRGALVTLAVTLGLAAGANRASPGATAGDDPELQRAQEDAQKAYRAHEHKAYLEAMRRLAALAPRSSRAL